MRTLRLRFAAVTLTALALTGCTTTAVSAPETLSPAASNAPSSDSTTTGSDDTAAPADVTALLNSLPVKGKAPKTGYDRVKDFGPAWELPGRTCSTRDLVLAHDLTNVVKDGACKVLSGVLNDPYTGKTINFRRGVDTSAEVQIDHVVPLANAWQTGAQQLTQQQRQQLANDNDINLIAVDGPTNGQKSDGDAATWLPPQKSFRCEYVTRQVKVKAKYHLWVTQPEKDAIVRVLATCGTAAVPAEQPTSAPTPVETQAPAAPAPVEEQPAAPQTGTVHPGAICSEQGAVGTSAAGKTYTCGKKGPDAAGRLHWNS